MNPSPDMNLLGDVEAEFEAIVEQLDRAPASGKKAAPNSLAQRDWDNLRDSWAIRMQAEVELALHEGMHKDRGRLLRRMMKEVGYRDRLRSDTYASDPLDVLGYDQAACTKMAISLMKTQPGTVMVVPSQGDQPHVGRPAYPGACPPNPYQWLPAVQQFSREGDTIWEVGPALTSSVAALANMIGRQVALAPPPMPAPAQQELHLTWAQDTGLVDDPGIGFSRPAVPSTTNLVLVPLPLPLDAWSFTDFIRAEVTSGGVGIFATQPELALDLDDYLAATLSRLAVIGKTVGQGGPGDKGSATTVVVAVPNVLGLPQTLVREISKQPGWSIIPDGGWITIEQGGTRHRGNGTTIPGMCIQAWEVQR